MVAPATTISVPVTARVTVETVTTPKVTTVILPLIRTVQPPLQPIGMTNIAPPIVGNQANLMDVIHAMQQSIERLQVAIENPPPRLEPPRALGTYKTPEQTSHNQHVTQTEDEESNGERRHPRSRRHEENYSEAHSARNTYANTSGNRAEWYSNAPIIIGPHFIEEIDLFPTSPHFKMPPCPPKRTRAPTSLEFNDSDLEGVSLPYDDALVITIRIDAFQVKQILVDTRISADILFEDAFLQIGISEDLVKPITFPFRFLSKSAERCLPFFKALRNIKNFEWTTECQASFDALKEYLASPPFLSEPVPGEELFLYLAVAESTVSEVLVQEEAARQLLIYYVSKVFQGAEQRYPDIEKLAFMLLMAARKLRPYFQSHTIVVLTDKPLRRILHKPDLSGHLVPWSVELGEFDIQYRSCPSIKGQALADFIVECTLPIEDEAVLPTPRSELFV
ncbi:hypothetical protein RJ639_015210 [Escallonia herrerae]|uniref:Reverse transcriptase/retrotransposon-derived protein RNase H-like domain-containing protein n=1 Tax=Escallonia herrerae TaxID=1293975 RepID=A0AA88VHD9_9ASTE|nr:hypothetical protein RJ639_015210 [Escallonia herrerae]